MLSYIWMKILETQPRRYDLGISMLSLGASERMKNRLVSENVHAGDRVVEIGCGTGTMAILAAARGARVLGFDVSSPMLEIAQEKIDHREVMLPALAAPGVDPLVIRRETVFRARFGPVSARDIPAYLASGKKETEAMRRFDFGLRHRLGFSNFGALFSEKELGEVRLDRALCRGCGTCFEICPIGVFGELDGDHKTTFAHHEACFSCSACVMQCPSGALSLDH